MPLRAWLRTGLRAGILIGILVTGLSSTAFALEAQILVSVDIDPPVAPSPPDVIAASDTGSSSNDNLTSNTTPTVTGTAETTSTVIVYCDGLPVGNAVSVGGVYTIPIGPLALGTHVLKATATDVSGNQSAFSTDVPVTIVAATAPSVAWTSAGQSVLESGGAVTATAQLSAVTDWDVSVPFTITGTAGGGDRTVSASPLTIPAGSTQAVVTVTASDDALVEANETVILTMGALVNASAGAPAVHTVTIVDDDSPPSVTVVPSGTLLTDENGRQALFSVRLNVMPSANVVIAVGNGDASEISLSTTQLTFTPANWQSDQTVLITGVDDAVTDGDQPCTVTLGLIGAGSNYAGIDPADVAVVNLDNEVPTALITQSLGTTQVAEGGANDSYTVVLSALPSGTVTVTVAADSQVTAVPSTLTFTTGLWNVPQTVTVTAVDDLVAQGGRAVFIAHSASGGGYGSAVLPSVAVQIQDNDSAQVVVAPSSGLITGENGAATISTIRLSSQPTANVRINLASSSPAEGTVSPNQVTFDTTNWNQPQTITLTGVDDPVADGDKAWSVITSACVSTDAVYNGLAVTDISASNHDNDVAAVIVSPTGGLITTEALTTATISVRLGSQPTANVTVSASSNDPSEGTVAPATLTFTAGDWSTPRNLTVTGVDDLIQDGDQAYAIQLTTSSLDPVYAALAIPAVSAINIDDDAPGVAVLPSGGSTQVTEGGATDSVDIKLTKAPVGGPVTITLSPDAQVTVSPSTLVFTSSDFNTVQTVTVAAVDDSRVEAAIHAGTISLSASGADYGAVVISPIAVAITDNDVAGITVAPISGLLTTEAGGKAYTFIRLSSQPSANVVIAVASNTTTEGVAAPASLTFTSANWNLPQTVTITGVDDAAADGNRSYTIVTSPAVSADSDYSGRNAADITATNQDDDLPAVLVSPNAVTVSENGSTATVSVRLGSQPLAPVFVNAISSNINEATVSPATLTFDDTDWNLPQEFTVTGVDDLLADGNQEFPLTLLISSADGHYGSLPNQTVQVTNLDNENATVLVSQTGLQSLHEGQVTTATYKVRLSGIPAANVTVTPTPDAQVTTSPASLLFDAGNWNVDQTVTVSVVDDQVAEGPHQGTVNNLAASTDPDYGGLATLVTIAIADDDSPGIDVTPVSGLTTTEIGGTATFSVVLLSKPTSSVDVPLVSSDAGQGSPTVIKLTFDGTNWSVPQTVTITGADGNAFEDGDVAYAIRVGPATSADGFYNGFLGPEVAVLNQAVDNPPTLDPIPAQSSTIFEDAGLQTIDLSGISNGQAGETQTASVGASSGNPALTGPLTVTYAGGAIGSVTFTPVANTFGVAVISVTVSDGVQSLTRNHTVTVTTLNDLPVVTTRTDLTVVPHATGNLLGHLEASDIETTHPTLLTYRILAAPSGGWLALGGTALQADDVFSQSDLDGGLITYTHNGALITRDSFYFELSDADGGAIQQSSGWFNIDRTAPDVALLPAGILTYTEAAAAVAIADSATVADANSTLFTGGSLAVIPISGGEATDLLRIVNQGTADGQIGLSGNAVTYGTPSGPAVIGTWSGGTGGLQLVVAFGPNSTPEAVQALLRAVVFEVTSGNPAATQRQFRITVTDETGLPSAPQLRDIAVIPVNTAPSGPDLDVATVPNLALSSQVVITDPDSPTLTYSVLGSPSKGLLTSFDTATGAFTYKPALDETGLDIFTVVANDGQIDSLPVAVRVHVTSGSDPQPWVVSDPPMEVQAGDTLHFVVDIDVADLPGPVALTYSLIGAPAGMTVVPDPAAHRASVNWAATGSPSGHLQFLVLVIDQTSSSAAVLPVTLYLHEQPGGNQ